MDRVRVSFSQYKGFIGMSMLRTVCHGWNTRRRYGQTPMACRWGCGKEDSDDIEHYVCCPRAWAL
eukprot:1766730-Alexandrium_andersonii.AAC.1